MGDMDPPPLLFGVRKEEITEGKKADRASKTKQSTFFPPAPTPPPLPLVADKKGLSELSADVSYHPRIDDRGYLEVLLKGLSLWR